MKLTRAAVIQEVKNPFKNDINNFGTNDRPLVLSKKKSDLYFMNQLHESVFSKPTCLIISTFWCKLTEDISAMLSFKQFLPFFLVATFFIACPLSYKVVCITVASAKDEFFAFSSPFVKIEAWKVPLAWTSFLWKKAGVTSLQACGKSFEIVGIAKAPTIDEFFTFYSLFVKIVAWKIRLAWTGFLW